MGPVLKKDQEVDIKINKYNATAHLSSVCWGGFNFAGGEIGLERESTVTMTTARQQQRYDLSVKSCKDMKKKHLLVIQLLVG